MLIGGFHFTKMRFWGWGDHSTSFGASRPEDDAGFGCFGCFSFSHCGAAFVELLTDAGVLRPCRVAGREGRLHENESPKGE
jgi:hypothetical protein